MNRMLILFAIAGVLLTPSCSDHEHAEETAPDREALAYTTFEGGSELFVEFKTLAVGEESPFAAHVTKLADFQPATEGKVTAILSGGGAATETFTSDAPSSPGIFRPVAKPSHAGLRNLSVVIEVAGFRDVHDLGEVTVYPTLEAAIAAAPAEEEDDGTITYLKEQQWKTDFATGVVATARLRAAVEATAELAPTPDGHAVVTAVVSGRIIPGALPRVGVEVSRNAVLATIAPHLGSGADLASLRLDVERARVAVAQANLELQRLEGLFAQEAVAERRVVDARAAAALAGAELRASEARLGQYQGTQVASGEGAEDRVTVRAPIDGVVARVGAVPGQAVDEGAVLFEIVRLDRLLLEVHVPEADIERLRDATGAAFFPQGFADEIDVTERGGRLLAMGGVVDPRTRTIPLVFELPNPDRALRAGMSGRAHVFTGGVTEALAIPASAVVDEDGRPVAYVEAGGEAFERRQLVLGVRDGELVEVVSGLAAGERVVTRGAYEIRLAAVSGDVPAHGHAH